MYADNILLLTPTVSYTAASLECMSVRTADIADYFCNLSNLGGRVYPLGRDNNQRQTCVT